MRKLDKCDFSVKSLLTPLLNTESNADFRFPFAGTFDSFVLKSSRDSSVSFMLMKATIVSLSHRLKSIIMNACTKFADFYCTVQDEGDNETYDRSGGCSLQPGGSTDWSAELKLKGKFELDGLVQVLGDEKFKKLWGRNSDFENFTDEFEDIHEDEIEKLFERVCFSEVSSEELIMNEDIRWIEERSSYGTEITPSFSYSKSERSSFLSRIFPFDRLKSLQLSPCVTNNSKFHSFLTAYQRVHTEKSDIQNCKNDLIMNQELECKEVVDATAYEQEDSKCSCSKCEIF